MKTEKVPIAEVAHDPANARKHSPRNIEAIKASLARFGQQKPIVLDSSNVVRAGNGTLEAARELGWTEIAVVRSELQGSEMTAFAIADNRTAELAEWDEDVLAATLQSLEHDDLPASDVGFDPDELREVLEAWQGSGDGSGDADNPYTFKIESPTYEPTGECPALGDLVDKEKTDRLLAQIDEADVPEDARAFLRLAALRHLRFSYKDIAEFYCHAEPEVQRLMEASALVIVDFESAIENGYVRVCERLRTLAGLAREENARE